MRKSRFSRFIGVLLALLAVSAMTLLQVDYANAAVQAQTTQVRIILSQAQLADLAKRDHALYAQVIKAYRSGAPLFVARHQYQVLSRLSTAYLGTARAGQPAPGVPGSATNPISIGKTPPLARAVRDSQAFARRRKQARRPGTVKRYRPVQVGRVAEVKRAKRHSPCNLSNALHRE